MKTPTPFLASGAAALFAAAIFAASALAQPPQPAAQEGVSAPAAQQGMAPGERPMRNMPAPTNLQVLPKDMNGHQVRELMETWAGSLGVHCNYCHAADPNNVGPNGRPRLNFPDDSKPEKKIARIMYTMTQQMNKDYISKAMDLDKDGNGSPVTCGTCHRGHQMPEDYVIPREERHEGPGAPPAAATPPSSN